MDETNPYGTVSRGRRLSLIGVLTLFANTRVVGNKTRHTLQGPQGGRTEEVLPERSLGKKKGKLITFFYTFFFLSSSLRTPTISWWHRPSVRATMRTWWSVNREQVGQGGATKYSTCKVPVLYSTSYLESTHWNGNISRCSTETGLRW